jgi:hypothetical protein
VHIAETKNSTKRTLLPKLAKGKVKLTSIPHTITKKQIKHNPNPKTKKFQIRKKVA